MAKRPYEPNSVLLFIDTTGGTTYDQVVCLTDWTYPKLREVIDSATMCGADQRVGSAKYGPIDFNGTIQLSAGSTEVGLTEMESVFANKTTVGWKLGPTTPVTGDVYYAGTGTISKLDLSASTDEVPTFSASLVIYGTPTTTTTA